MKKVSPTVRQISGARTGLRRSPRETNSGLVQQLSSAALEQAGLALSQVPSVPSNDEPEHMLRSKVGVCHGCATKYLDVVF